MQAVRFALNALPASDAAKEASGLPLSCAVQPYGRLEEQQPRQQQQPQCQCGTSLQDILRCGSCYGYINHLAKLEPPSSWLCPLCHKRNEIGQAWASRYAAGGASSTLPELQSATYDVLVHEAGPFTATPQGDAQGPAPIFVALVDASRGADEEFLESVRSGLRAALEALPPPALFGLVTFSDVVGLHDLRCGAPAVRFVPVPSVPLDEAMPLRALLAPVGTHKDAITAALEAMEPHGGCSCSGVDEAPGSLRGCGPALVGVLELLQATRSPPFTMAPTDASATPQLPGDVLPTAHSPVRLCVFLSGPPDHGPGRLVDPQALAQGDEWLRHVDPATTTFWSQAAVAAAALGCCTDLYAICARAVGLKHLAPLSSSTGGAVCLYPSVEEALLPQDLYLRVSGQHASAGLLRVRTSTGIQAARYYGGLYPDAQIEGLQHVVSCSTSDTFMFDLAFGGSKRASRSPITDTPTVQVAFQYSVVTSAQEPAGCMIQRRLRVATYEAGIAAGPLEAMHSCSSDVVLAALLHKAQRVAGLQGSPRARTLLCDWLVELVFKHHCARHCVPGAAHQQQGLRHPVNVGMADTVALQSLPRFVYALLKSPLLTPATTGPQHPDLAALLEHRFERLSPRELVRAVYPSLSAFADPETMVMSGLPLTQASVQAPSAPPIFLLDAYYTVLVLYTAACSSQQPYPPPQQSKLRAAMRQERTVAPKVQVVRGGSDEAHIFLQHLLDDPTTSSASEAAPGGAGVPLNLGLQAFMEHIRLEVIRMLKA